MPDDPATRSTNEIGEQVWVFVLGTWQPGVVVGAGEPGHVLARYRRLDGRTAERQFPQSSVMDAR